MQDAMFAPSSYNETNTTGSTNIYLEKSDKDSSQILSVTPQVGSIQTKYSYIDSKTYQMDLG